MQISNSAISQYLSSSVNRPQQADRFPVKPVTIEGELVDDKKKTLETNKGQDENSQDSNFGSLEQSKNETDSQLITPVPAGQSLQKSPSEDLGQSLLIQTKLNANPNSLQQNESSEKNNFPYTNRRSSEGLAGGSLVIQKYLNNEPPALFQPENSQSYSRNHIDIFI